MENENPQPAALVCELMERAPLHMLQIKAALIVDCYPRCAAESKVAVMESLYLHPQKVNSRYRLIVDKRLKAGDGRRAPMSTPPTPSSWN